tara:strand:+ start:2471 stop:2659 length:189 start_codon:yes stop_codon:yes gene_type:complete
MKCCLCKEEIKPDKNGWKEGHNAWPLEEDGRCCEICNIDVLGARLMLHQYINDIIIVPDAEA